MLAYYMEEKPLNSRIARLPATKLPPEAATSLRYCHDHTPQTTECGKCKVPFFLVLRTQFYLRKYYVQ